MPSFIRSENSRLLPLRSAVCAFRILRQDEEIAATFPSIAILPSVVSSDDAPDNLVVVLGYSEGSHSMLSRRPAILLLISLLGTASAPASPAQARSPDFDVK